MSPPSTVLASLPRITSRRHPLVQACREARTGGSDQPLLLDGWHLLQEAVAAGVPIDAVAVGAEPREVGDVACLRVLIERGAQVVGVTPDVLHTMSPVRTPSGVVALGRRPALSIDAVLSRRPALAVVLVDVQDPGNVGALVRVVEALGGTGVVVAGSSADLWGWKALRASMGSAFRVPVAPAPDPQALVSTMRTHGLAIVALRPSGGRRPNDVDLRADTALLLGAEGAGLRPELLSMADVSMTVPMASTVESLNVTVAGALALYEARAQRGPGR